MKDEVMVLQVAPGEYPRVSYMYADWRCFDTAVSIGSTYPCHAEAVKLEEGVYMLRNSEGCLLGLKGNRRVESEIIAGVFYIIGVEPDGKVVSLSEETCKKYMMKFWSPEYYTDSEVWDSVFDI